MAISLVEFYLTLSNSGWAGSRDSRVDRLWAMIVEEYDRMPNLARLSVLRWTMFKKGLDKFACLRGHAMEVHHLLSVLPAVLERLNDGSTYHEVRLSACRTLLNLHKVCADHDVMLPREAANRALSLADDFLLFNNFLLKTDMGNGHLMYHMTFKHHLLWHIAMMSTFQNPRWAACFEFEDFMGKIKLCAKSTQVASPLYLVGAKVIEHYLLALHLKLAAM